MAVIWIRKHKKKAGSFSIWRVKEGRSPSSNPSPSLIKGRGIKGEGYLIENLKVNCYSGHTYAEEPRSFEWQGIEYEVEEIEKAWQEPEKRYFQVRTRDNKLFRLCYNETEKQWSITELVKS